MVTGLSRTWQSIIYCLLHLLLQYYRRLALEGNGLLFLRRFHVFGFTQISTIRQIRDPRDLIPLLHLENFHQAKVLCLESEQGRILPPKIHPIWTAAIRHGTQLDGLAYSLHLTCSNYIANIALYFKH
jgi:hypothetical protein